MNKTMKRSDLTNKHIVVFRDGSVASDEDLCDMTSDLLRRKDIMKVYTITAPNDICVKETASDWENRSPIWKREEPKEMTIEEIEKELGYSIKVIKDKEDKNE